MNNPNVGKTAVVMNYRYNKHITNNIHALAGGVVVAV